MGTIYMMVQYDQIILQNKFKLYFLTKIVVIFQKIELNIGYRHSSVEYSAPTIQPPRVRVPSTPSTLLSFGVFLLYLSCEKNENKQKEDGFGPFKKM